MNVFKFRVISLRIFLEAICMTFVIMSTVLQSCVFIFDADNQLKYDYVNIFRNMIIL